MSWAFFGCIVAAGCAPSHHRPGSAGTSAPAQSKQAFFNARAHTAEYAGPGRELPPPKDIDEVRIGWFGPTDPDHAEAGQMWQAAALAIEQANLAGGYKGLPFRLVTSWSENPWGTGIRGVTGLVYREGVWAMVGAPDGPSAHLVEQVVAKARLTFLNPVSTDKTANLINVPWIFSCAPGDHLLAPVLAQALVRFHPPAGGSGDFAVVSGTDHDARLFTRELLGALTDVGAFPALHLALKPGSSDFTAQLQAIGRARPDAVVLIAGPQDAARFLTALRQASPRESPTSRDRKGAVALTPRVFGGPTMGRRLFIETAGRAAEGVVFPLLWDRSVAGERSAAFARRFEERFGTGPDYTAAYTYDAVNLLIAAVGEAGLNRARIRDAVRELSPWIGVSGTITWDPTGQNHGPVRLGVIRDGQVRPAAQGHRGASPTSGAGYGDGRRAGAHAGRAGQKVNGKTWIDRS